MAGTLRVEEEKPTEVSTEVVGNRCEDETSHSDKLGYRRQSVWVSELFNITGALVLLLLAAPIILLITLVVWVREGRPIFYRGARLGINKEIFFMFKFRSLVTDAEAQLRENLLGKRCDLVTSTGKFLRETRLDELPQLFNVLRRDMDLVGPRPVRPLVYEKMCQQIPNYDRRFEVRPGLVGFSQIFTPHSTPKEIRSLIDNRLLRKKEKVWWSVKALVLTACLLVRTFVLKVHGIFMYKLVQQVLLRRYNEKRRYDRIRTRNATCLLPTLGGEHDYRAVGEVLDINVEAFLLRTDVPLPQETLPRLRLEIIVRKTGRGNGKRKFAICRGQIMRTMQRNGGWEYVIQYEPSSPLNCYLVAQYFLRESVG